MMKSIPQNMSEIETSNNGSQKTITDIKEDEKKEEVEAIEEVHDNQDDGLSLKSEEICKLNNTVLLRIL